MLPAWGIPMALSFLKISDPLQVLREALTQLESGLNSLAASGIKSHRGMRALHRAIAVVVGLQRLADAFSDDLLRGVNMPSRQQIDELTATLRRVEDKLDSLHAALAPDAPLPRPPRTRRPAVATPEPEADKPAPRRTARRTKA